MPVRTGFPRTTHKWLKPLYDALDASFGYVVPSGASGIANALWSGKGVPLLQLGNASGMVSLYGASGIAGQLATGTNGSFNATSFGASGFGATGLGASGFYTFASRFSENGGSGTFYTLGDLVTQLKNLGAIKQ